MNEKRQVLIQKARFPEKCPNCKSHADKRYKTHIEYECGSVWDSMAGYCKPNFSLSLACPIIADLRWHEKSLNLRLQEKEDELWPLREMREFISDGFRDQGGMGDPWGSIYGDLLSEWAKATARRNREKGERNRK